MTNELLHAAAADAANVNDDAADGGQSSARRRRKRTAAPQGDPALRAWPAEELARLAGVHPRSILRAMDRGELPEIRIGKCRRIPGAAALKWLAGTSTR